MKGNLMNIKAIILLATVALAQGLPVIANATTTTVKQCKGCPSCKKPGCCK
jgi:hypothetical protein